MEQSPDSLIVPLQMGHAPTHRMLESFAVSVAEYVAWMTRVPQSPIPCTIGIPYHYGSSIKKIKNKNFAASLEAPGQSLNSQTEPFEGCHIGIVRTSGNLSDY